MIESFYVSVAYVGFVKVDSLGFSYFLCQTCTVFSLATRSIYTLLVRTERRSFDVVNHGTCVLIVDNGGNKFSSSMQLDREESGSIVLSSISELKRSKRLPITLEIHCDHHTLYSLRSSVTTIASHMQKLSTFGSK